MDSRVSWSLPNQGKSLRARGPSRGSRVRTGQERNEPGLSSAQKCLKGQPAMKEADMSIPTIHMKFVCAVATMLAAAMVMAAAPELPMEEHQGPAGLA